MAFTESNYLSDFVKYEAEREYSRENVTILAGSGSARALTAGMILGQITKAAATGAAVAGNTGNGTITASPTVGVAAKVGTYTLTCIEPATNLGKFQVEDPDGIVIGIATVATAFTTHLTFTIADGATDFASGDAFTIVVAAGSGKVKQIDFSATDGADKAYGVLLRDATAADGTDGAGVAIVRHAILETSHLTWPSGASAPQKAAALATLQLAGVLSRAGV